MVWIGSLPFIIDNTFDLN